MVPNLRALGAFFVLGLACAGASDDGPQYPGDALARIDEACRDNLVDPKRCDGTCHNAGLNHECPESDIAPLDELTAYAECRHQCTVLETCADNALIVDCDCEVACVAAQSQALQDGLAFARDCGEEVPECQ